MYGREDTDREGDVITVYGRDDTDRDSVLKGRGCYHIVLKERY